MNNINIQNNMTMPRTDSGFLVSKKKAQALQELE